MGLLFSEFFTKGPVTICGFQEINSIWKIGAVDLRLRQNIFFFKKLPSGNIGDRYIKNIFPW